MAASMRHEKRKERLKMRNKMKKNAKKKAGFLTDQSWKPFEVDMSVFADEEMEGFVGLEVLKDYDPKLLQKYTSGTTVKKFSNSSATSQGAEKSEHVKPQAIKTKHNTSNSTTIYDSKAELPASDSISKSKKNKIKKKSNSKKESLKIKSKTNWTEIPKGKDGNLKSAAEKIEKPMMTNCGRTDKVASKNENTTEGRTNEFTKKKKTKEVSTERTKVVNDKDGLKMKEQKKEDQKKEETSEGKMERRKRKSGREQLEELRMKRKRRKGEQMEGLKEELKTNVEETDKNDTDLSMVSWGNLLIPSLVHKALASMGFTKPTSIQEQCIPAAVGNRQDMVGAAETGSGKTLAFGIPLIYWLLKHRAESSTNENLPSKETNRTTDVETVEVDNNEEIDNNLANDVNNADDDMDTNKDDEEEQDQLQKRSKTLKLTTGCVDVVDDIRDQEWMKAGLALEDTLEIRSRRGGKLFGLILTPTRELAVQVKNHLVAATKYADVKIAVVVGGMSAEKQKRVLKKRPGIIVGTPGRLWELYKLGEPHLCSLPDIQCLVIDEADRMVEKGHYAELSEILDLLNSSENRAARQTFVFSATLSLIHLGPLRKSLKKAFKMDKKEKLDSVMAKVGVKENVHVVDLTNKEGTASTLLESKIVCEVEEKDIYLFYFLRQYPGRTLVFTNSIDCIRRLVSILNLLECQPLPLHSSMHQKQRLKNLERFTSNPRGLLLATDVAARGLDIPDIEHVIHYQVPRTSESYVHRSGRTARQAKSGLSVTFLSSSEINFYRRLCKTLNREELPSFPIEHSYYREIKARVDLARDIDKMEHVNSKKKHQNDWFLRAAKELDVDLDENMDLHDMGDSCEQKQFNKKIRTMRALLKTMLKKKIFASGSSQLYLTSGGNLVSPFSPADGANQAFTKLQARIKKDRKEEKSEKDKKRKKFKRMGRYKQQKSS